MKVAVIIFYLIIISSTLLSQNSFTYFDRSELKIGGEINQAVPSVGIGKNIYFSKYNSISPEIIMLGFPIASGTYRFNFRINKNLRTSIQGGGGITFGVPLSFVGIIGANLSYKISNNIDIFIEPRLYIFPKSLTSIDNGIWGLENINKTKPFVLSIGVGL